jgi:putative phage-type endonuclease
MTTTLTAPREVLPWNAPRSDWLAARIPAVTATDITALCGLHPYRSAWEVYQEKIGDPLPDTAGEAAQIGVALEPVIADMWQARPEGKPLARVGLIEHGDHPWMRCSPDRLAVSQDWIDMAPSPEGNGDSLATRLAWTEGVVELKTALGWAHLDFTDDSVPDRHLFQVQWQLAVTGLPRAWLVALAGPALKTYEVERDQALIDNLMAIGERFLTENVAKRHAPAPDGSERLAGLLSKRWEPDPDKTVILNPADYWPLRNTIALAAAQKKAATAKETEAKNALRLLIADAEAAVIDGETVATWRQSERAGFTVAPTTTRTLRFTKAGS